MLIFYAECEGGILYPLKLTTTSGKPAKRIKHLKRMYPIMYFRCGMVWDKYIKRYTSSGWRHKCFGGRRHGKERFKFLVEFYKREGLI